MTDGPNDSPPDTDAGKPWSLLARGVGTWEGPDRTPPAPGAAEERDRTGRTIGRAILGGRGWAADHVQRNPDGSVALRRHTVVRWDAEAAEFTLDLFVEPGRGSTRLRGRRDADRIVFLGEGPTATLRHTLEYGPELLRVRSESQGEEGAWVSTFLGEYRRVEEAPSPGTFGWHDLTVRDAPTVRDFYARVVGWRWDAVPMGDYRDFNLVGRDGTPRAGVCHARGANAGLPAVWLPYIVVADLEASLRASEEAGGAMVQVPRRAGGGRMAVLRDPAGAVFAVWEPDGADPGGSSEARDGSSS